MDTQGMLLEAFLKYVLPPLATAVGALLVKSLFELSAWLKSKKDGSKAALVGATLSEMASSVVAHVDVEMRPKVAKAFEDGRLTAEEGAELKREAMRLLMERVPDALRKGAEELFGPLLQTYLSGLVERAHAALPDMGPGPSNSAMPTPPERPSMLPARASPLKAPIG